MTPGEFAAVHEPARLIYRPSGMHGTPEQAKSKAPRQRSIKLTWIALALLAGFVAGGVLAYAAPIPRIVDSRPEVAITSGVNSTVSLLPIDHNRDQIVCFMAGAPEGTTPCAPLPCD